MNKLRNMKKKKKLLTLTMQSFKSRHAYIAVSLLLLFQFQSLASYNRTSRYHNTNENVKNLPVGIVITGSVVSDKNVPIEGVTVYVKNGGANATTDKNGKFSIRVSDKKAILVFTMMNYSKIQRVVGDETNIHVILNETSSSLNDVVVVAYGKQRKIDVTSAVSTISGESIVDAPVANISNALIGSSSGISGLTSSGEPGRNQSTINIRGLSSFNTAGVSPLVVIDGIEQPAEQPMAQLDAMDANEIKSISILKDAASTAVYGIRGANGVIIVTTKEGIKGKQIVSASLNTGATKASNLVKTSNSYEFAQMRNEAIGYENNENNNTSYNNLIFSDEDLWKFQHNRDYTPAEVNAMSITDAQKAQLNTSPAIWYGSQDLMKQEFGGSGIQKQANVNIRGGTDRVTYFTSVGYFSQGSILGNTSFDGSNTASTYDRYNYRSNIVLNSIPNTSITLSFAGQFGIVAGPGGNTSTTDNTARYKAMTQYIQEGNPFVVPGIIDGHLISTWGGIAGSTNDPLGLKTTTAGSPVAQLLTSGEGVLYNTLLTNTIRVVHKLSYILPGLTFTGNLSYDDNYNKTVVHNPSIPTYTFTRDALNPNILDFYGGAKHPDALNVNAASSVWNKTYLDGGFNYIKNNGQNRLTALLLGKASVYNMPGDSYHVPSGIEGFAARVTESYKQRYMGEIDLGYNGTEQFAPSQRFGFFPAVSVGWVISSEKFFPKAKWIDYVKIRGSFGIVGSDNLGGRRFLYNPSVFLQNQSGYYLGPSNGSSANSSNVGGGTLQSFVGNPNVTWETSKKTNLGLESNLLNGHIVFGLDVFFDRRDHILTTLGNIPATLGIAGANLPPANVGIVTNHGYELSLAYNNHIQAVGFSVSGNLSYAHNKIIYKAEAPYPYSWMDATGFSIGQYKGLKSDGFFNTPQQLTASPYNSYNSNQKILGDIRYKDINGDGIIDNSDMVPIGYPNLPEYAFNINSKFTYHGFDFSILFNGTANGSFALNPGYTFMFFKTWGMTYQWQYDDRWTPEKAASGAKILYPRAQINPSSASANFIPSDFWLKSSNFIKIKNLVVGYTLNAQELKKAGIGITSIRFYANANNLLTFKNALTKYGFDPEILDTNTSYVFPLTHAFIVGANIIF